MEHLTQTFAQCKQEGRPALVTYVTAGFPTAEETPEIMLGMQAGGVGQSSFCETISSQDFKERQC